MKFIVPSNDKYVRIGFADTYKQLPDEYGYAAAPKYEAQFSNFNLLDIFSTQRSRDAKAAETEATKAKTELDKQIAKALAEPAPTTSTTTKVLVGVAIVAMLGVTIWAIKR